MPDTYFADELAAAGIGNVGATVSRYSTYNAANPLPTWRRKRNEARAGALTGPVRILMWGDSKTAGSGAGTGGTLNNDGAFARSRPAQLAKLLRASGFNARLGFCGFNGLATPALRMTYDPRAVLNTVTGGSRSLGTLLNLGTPGSSSIVYQQDGLPVDRFSVVTQWDNGRTAFNISKGSETFTLTPNGGATTIMSRQEVVFTTRDTSPVTIAKVTGNTTPILAGISWDSLDPGIEIMNAGVIGITAATWVTPHTNSGTDTLPTVGVYAPHLTIINIGTNDFGSATVQAFSTNVGIMIDAAKPSGDVIVCFPSVGGADGSGGTDANRLLFKAALVSLCASKGVMFLDEDALLGGRAGAVASGAFFDTLHEMAWGYGTQADALHRVLMAA